MAGWGSQRGVPTLQSTLFACFSQEPSLKCPCAQIKAPRRTAPTIELIEGGNWGEPCQQSWKCQSKGKWKELSAEGLQTFKPNPEATGY